MNTRKVYKGEIEEKYPTAVAAEQNELCTFITKLSSIMWQKFHLRNCLLINLLIDITNCSSVNGF